jgi:hypothetical protein
MKTRISSPIYKMSLALLLLATGTFSFAQRHEGGGRGQGSQGQPQRQMGARPEMRQPRQERPASSPGMQSSPRMRTERPAFNRPQVTQRPPTAERPAVQRPADNQVRSNPGFQQRQRPQTTPAPSTTRPDNNVRSNDVRVDRFNNNNNRAGRNNNWNNNNRSDRFDNRVAVNRPRPTSYNGYYRGSANYYRPRPHYSRPPVIWQGRRFYTHYNYNYHPYRPYYYGSFFHPFGFYLGSLGAAAVMFSWNDQYYGYDQGVYYAPYNGGYQVVPAPTGASIRALPNGYTTVSVDSDTYYYFAGTFYVTGSGGYEIVAAPPGAIVYDLPEGAREMKVDDATYLEYNGNYYQPISINGRDGYEVVDIVDDDNE